MSEEGEQDDASKTEEATHKRLEDALEKGQVINSREVTSFMALVGLTAVVVWILPMIFYYFSPNLKLLIEHAGSIDFNQSVMGSVLRSIIGKALLYLSPIFLLIIAITILSHFMQQGEIVFSLEPITPDLSRLSMIKGIKKMFAQKNLVEFLKNIAKLTLVGIFLTIIIAYDIQELRMYPALSVGSIIILMSNIVKHLLICVCITMGIIAGIDYFYQRYQYFHSLRMTKQEVKDEYKQTEGDPDVKRRQRKKMREQSKRQLTTTVPESTVVITNPEHFAVALKYHADEQPIPIVIAKGMDLIALQIKEIANENDVPIVESPPLARALYKETDIDQPIPLEHYEAVAKIISYVYSLQGKNK